MKRASRLARTLLATETKPDGPGYAEPFHKAHPSSPHPASEGLRWVTHGFSTLGLSDHEILDREFIVYNALYAECRKRVVA